MVQKSVATFKKDLVLINQLQLKIIQNILQVFIIKQKNQNKMQKKY